jgi:hypothetical protein
MSNREEILRQSRTPKVQIWDRRARTKLSGKRTLFPTNSGKLPAWDTDGVNLVGSLGSKLSSSKLRNDKTTQRPN